MHICYEKEFLTIITTVDKWRSYLFHSIFIIRKDRQSLKYLLEQKISNPLQHKYLIKLLGFDYTIEYRQGKENVLADAFSRRGPSEGTSSAITLLKPTWIKELHSNYEGDMLVSQVITEKRSCPYNLSLYDYVGGVTKFKGELMWGQPMT